MALGNVKIERGLTAGERHEDLGARLTPLEGGKEFSSVAEGTAWCLKPSFL